MPGPRAPCRSPRATAPIHRPRPAQKAAEVGLDCLPVNDIGAALEDLLATQPAPMRILICGSLYLAGAVLARNGYRAIRAQAIEVLIQLTSFCFGSAPILVAATWPFLNSSRVGIERTP